MRPVKLPPTVDDLSAPRAGQASCRIFLADVNMIFDTQPKSLATKNFRPHASVVGYDNQTKPTSRNEAPHPCQTKVECTFRWLGESTRPPCACVVYIVLATSESTYSDDLWADDLPRYVITPTTLGGGALDRERAKEQEREPYCTALA